MFELLYKEKGRMSEMFEGGLVRKWTFMVRIEEIL